jgi:CheY-like chemotaxis protein
MVELLVGANPCVRGPNDHLYGAMLESAAVPSSRGDDAPVTIPVACSVLEAEGYNVEVASNGVEAAARLQTPPEPALVLLDLMMPVMDGITLLRELEQHAELSKIPIIVMTAASKTPETSGLRYPMLRKPFALEELLHSVTTYAPRLWDDEEAVTDARAGLTAPVALRDTTRERCVECLERAAIRCPRCGEALCLTCFDADHGRHCAEGRAFT